MKRSSCNESVSQAIPTLLGHSSVCSSHHIAKEVGFDSCTCTEDAWEISRACPQPQLRQANLTSTRAIHDLAASSRSGKGHLEFPKRAGSGWACGHSFSQTPSSQVADSRVDALVLHGHAFITWYCLRRIWHTKPQKDQPEVLKNTYTWRVTLVTV